MAIIHTTPKQAGTEGLLKLLDSLTDEIVLIHGKILMGSFSHGSRDALKLSLFVTQDVYEYIGVRNVFIEDIGETVVVRYGDKEETQMALEVLRQTKDWALAFPDDHRAIYQIDNLNAAAYDVRDYLLFGKLPGTEVSEQLLKLINTTVPEKGFVEFNVLASLTDYDF
jgi:hypothetical protein